MKNEANCSLGTSRTGGSKKGAGGGIMLRVLVGYETRAVGKSAKTSWTTTRRLDLYDINGW